MVRANVPDGADQIVTRPSDPPATNESPSGKKATEVILFDRSDCSLVVKLSSVTRLPVVLIAKRPFDDTAVPPIRAPRVDRLLRRVVGAGPTGGEGTGEGTSSRVTDWRTGSTSVTPSGN